MMRTVTGTLTLLLLGAGLAGAQSKPAGDLTRQLIGTWEGPYQSESVPPGTLKLTVAQGEKQEWKVTLAVFADDPPPVGEVKEFKVEGNTISWSQEVAEMICAHRATLVAGVLKGGAECSQGGAVVVTATYLLEKQP